MPFSSIAFFENNFFGHDTYQIGYRQKKRFKNILKKMINFKAMVNALGQGLVPLTSNGGLPITQPGA
jgi:hypothetical protein